MNRGTPCAWRRRCQLPAVRACRSAPMFCYFLPIALVLSPRQHGRHRASNLGPVTSSDREARPHRSSTGRLTTGGRTGHKRPDSAGEPDKATGREHREAEGHRQARGTGKGMAQSGLRTAKTPLGAIDLPAKPQPQPQGRDFGPQPIGQPSPSSIGDPEPGQAKPFRRGTGRSPGHSRDTRQGLFPQHPQISWVFKTRRLKPSALVGKGRITGDDEAPTEMREIGGHVGEIVLLLVAR